MTGDEEAVFRRLLSRLPRYGTGRRWDLADPYLRRHAAEHAARVGGDLLGELLSDGEYLVNADPRSVTSALSPFRDVYGGFIQQLLDVYCASVSWHQRVDPRARRQILALDALRLGHRELAASMERLPGGRVLPWHCVWSSATNVSPSAGATMTGHAEAITALTVTEVAGRLVAATGSKDHTVRIWDLTTGRTRHVLLHGSPVTSFASALLDGRPVLVTGSDRVTRWDLSTGRPMGSLSVGSPVRQLVIDDSGLIAMATETFPYVADLRAEAEPPRPVRAAGQRVRFVAVCREGNSRFALAVTEGSYVSAFALPGGELRYRDVLRRNGNAADRITALATRDVDGQCVAVVGHASGACTAFHAHSGLLVHSLLHPAVTEGRRPLGERNEIDSIEIHPSAHGWRAVAGHRDGMLRTWDLGSGGLLREERAHAGRVTDLVTTTVNGRRVLLTASEDDTVRSWDAETGELRDVLAGHTSGVNRVAPALSGTRPVAVTVSKDRTVRTWDLRNRRPARLPGEHPNWVRTLGLHRIDGRLYAVTSCRDASIRVLDAGTGENVGECTDPDGQPLQAADVLTDRGYTWIAAGGEQGRLHLWEYGRPEPRESTDPGPSAVTALAILARDRRWFQVVAGRNDGALTVWYPGTGEELRLLTPPGRGRDAGVSALAVAATPHGTVVLSGAYDGTCRTLLLRDGRPLLLHSHRYETPVKAVAIGSVAGEPVTAAGDESGRITLNRLTDGTVLRTLLAHTGPVRSLAFSRVGHVDALVSGSSDGTVRIWETSTGTQLDRIDLPDYVQTVAHADGVLAIGYGREVSVFTPSSRPAQPEHRAEGSR
ncbi:WD40 repeat domain-containing protein [Streptomyces sp. NPDC058052]|uniref:WD40 repeat domain-containing protein n=1 Tax=Streptomyces sp. NPDC058052 TaxID=3346316 RepID=UPI0036E5C8F6